MTESLEGIGPIPRVEVVTGRDGVLPAVGRTAVTPGERVGGVVVVSHQLDHGLHVTHLRGVPDGEPTNQKIIRTGFTYLANIRALGVLSYENQSPYSLTSSEFPLLLNTSE